MLPTTPIPKKYLEDGQLTCAVEMLLDQPYDVRAYVLAELSPEDLYVVGLYLEAAYGPSPRQARAV
jgi:hypothetical protein